MLHGPNRPAPVKEKSNHALLISLPPTVRRVGVCLGSSTVSSGYVREDVIKNEEIASCGRTGYRRAVAAAATAGLGLVRARPGHGAQHVLLAVVETLQHLKKRPLFPTVFPWQSGPLIHS